MPPHFLSRLMIHSPDNDFFAIGQEMDAPEHVPHVDVHVSADDIAASANTISTYPPTF